MKRTRTVILLLIALFLISSSAYCKSPEEARKELAQKHIEYSKDAFFDSVKSGDTAIVNLFLDAGMNPNSKQDDQYGLTALYFSIYKEDLTTIKALLSKGANINARIKDNVTPLIAAVESGNTSIVKTLIENGADVNLQMKKGVTALMIASMTGQADIVKILLNNKADVNAKTDQGVTALDFAKQKKNTDIVALLRNTEKKKVSKTSQQSTGKKAVRVEVADLEDSREALEKRYGSFAYYTVSGYAYAEADDIKLCEKQACTNGGDICIKVSTGNVAKEVVRHIKRETSSCKRIPVIVTGTIIPSYIAGESAWDLTGTSIELQ